MRYCGEWTILNHKEFRVGGRMDPIRSVLGEFVHSAQLSASGKRLQFVLVVGAKNSATYANVKLVFHANPPPSVTD